MPNPHARPPVPVYEKHPNEELVIIFDWSYNTGTAIISASAWTITVPGDGLLTIVSQSFTNTTATVVLGAGTNGQLYQVENKVTIGIAKPVGEANVKMIDK